MKIFKAFMKVLLKRLNSSLIYVVIFIIIGFAMTKSSADEKGYENIRLNVSVTDLDDSEASRAVINYIKKNHDIVTVGSSKDEKLDALYYQTADIILTIENGFSDKLAAGETEGLFNEYSIPSTYRTQLLDSQLNRYIATVNAYVTGGESLQTAFKKADAALSGEVETTMYSSAGDDQGTLNKNVYYFLKYLAYIFIAVLISGLCPVILAMNRKDIRRRINCSSISTNSQLLQITMGILVYVAGLMTIIMTAAAIFYKSELFTYYGLLGILNSFVLIITAMMICLLVSVLAPSEKSLNMISNVIALGMSFLCGVFVPQNMLGGAAVNLGRLMPAYWYVKALNLIGEQEGEIFSKSEIFICIGIQLAFAVALFAVSMVIAKTKRQSRS